MWEVIGYYRRSFKDGTARWELHLSNDSNVQVTGVEVCTVYLYDSSNAGGYQPQLGDKVFVDRSDKGYVRGVFKM